MALKIRPIIQKRMSQRTKKSRFKSVSRIKKNNAGKSVSFLKSINLKEKDLLIEKINKYNFDMGEYTNGGYKLFFRKFCNFFWVGTKFSNNTKI